MQISHVAGPSSPPGAAVPKLPLESEVPTLLYPGVVLDVVLFAAAVLLALAVLPGVAAVRLLAHWRAR